VMCAEARACALACSFAAAFTWGAGSSRTSDRRPALSQAHALPQSGTAAQPPTPSVRARALSGIATNASTHSSLLAGTQLGNRKAPATGSMSERHA
jgi:hypothetical protein